jgi:hypothetical protein
MSNTVANGDDKFKVEDIFSGKKSGSYTLIIVLAVIAVLFLIYYMMIREPMANPSNPRTMTEAEWSKVAMGH